MSGGVSGVLRFVHNQRGAQNIGLYDINGDGLPDQVGNPNSGVYRLDVRLNRGHSLAPEIPWVYPAAGSCERTALRLPEGPDPQQHPSVVRDFFDINGDGLPDIVDTCGWTASNQRWWVVLNRGNGFAPTTMPWHAPKERIRHIDPSGGVNCEGDAITRSDVFDIDGDGQVDLVDFAAFADAQRQNNQAGGAWCASTDGVGCSGSGGSQVAPDPAGGRRGLLVQVENGIGGTTSLTYRPSTQWDNTDASGTPRLPLVLWTVTRIARDDGLCDDGVCTGSATGHEVSTDVTYAYGLYEPGAREFRGFRTVEQAEAAPAGAWQRTTTTWFHQDAGLEGKVQESDQASVTETTDGWIEGPLLRMVQNLWACVDPATGIQWSECPAVLTPPERRWVRLSGSNAYSYPSPSKAVSTRTRSWDQYGNATHVTTWGSGSLTLDAYTEYAYPDTPTTYLVDKPRHVRLVENGATLLEEQWFFYDDQPAGGVVRDNPTAMESCLDQWTQAPPPCAADPGRRCVRTAMTYEAPYGNVETVSSSIRGDKH